MILDEETQTLYHYSIHNVTAVATPDPRAWTAFDEPTLKRIWDSFWANARGPKANWEYAVYMPVPVSRLGGKLRLAHFSYLKGTAATYDLPLEVQWKDYFTLGNDPPQLEQPGSAAGLWREQHLPNAANHNLTNCWGCKQEEIVNRYVAQRAEIQRRWRCDGAT